MATIAAHSNHSCVPSVDVDYDDILVSVILPTFNGASRGFLRSAIESVLAQTHARLELIIVNDGSTDETAAILTELVDPRVALLEQPNAGVAAALHTGIERSQGEFVCFLGDDDRWLSTKLERQIAHYYDRQRNCTQTIGLVATPILLVDVADRLIGLQHFSANGDIYLRLFTTNLIAASTVMIPREVLQSVGSIDAELTAAEDLDLWLRIAHDHPVFTMDEPLVEYRVHPNRLSTQLDLMHREKRRVIERAIERNRRTDVELKRTRILFEIEKQYFDRYISINDPPGARRHFANAARLAPMRVATEFRMPVKRALAGLKLGRWLATTSPTG